MPLRWKRIIARRVAHLDAQHRDWRHGNEYLRERSDGYQQTVFPLHTTDSEIRACAEDRAKEAMAVTDRAHDKEAIAAVLVDLCQRWNVRAPEVDGERVTMAGMIARVCDAQWWSRNLRAMHGVALESEAIRLGLVHKGQDCYVSEENLQRRAQQNRHNQKVLERTFAVNEDGEAFSLWDLAQRSISNKAYRRGELMLRMRGMEEVAAGAGHPAEFTVVTPPSRFHCIRANGTINEKYQGVTPKDTMRYLNRQWQGCRAWLQRRGVEFYGMRTVEAHHDGTPHWNFLCFFARPEHVKVWREAIRRYFLLADSPDEKGAAEHRLRFEVISKEQGGATAYIAKYISKNIDGMGIETDLLGNDIVTATQRVEAWAKTWRIQQFRPIGGVPVGLWREVRKMEEGAVANAPDCLKRAYAAAQRIKGAEGEEDKRADFAEFIRAYGGPLVKRKAAPMWLHKETREGVGKYGEPLGERVAGVVARGMGEVDKGGIVGTIRTVVTAVVKSVRRQWTVIRARAREAAPSRTRVNNCTRPSGAASAGQKRPAWMDGLHGPELAPEGAPT